MKHHAAGRNHVVPSADEILIHLLDRGERSTGEFADAGVAEVRVGGDEVDLRSPKVG